MDCSISLTEVMSRVTELMSNILKILDKNKIIDSYSIRSSVDVISALECLEDEAAELNLAKFELASMSWSLNLTALTLPQNGNIVYSIKNLRAEMKDLLFAARDHSAILQERIRIWRLFYSK